MSNWQFRDVIVTDDSLEVRGTADLSTEERGRLVGDPLVRFVLIQDPEQGSTDPEWRFNDVSGIGTDGTFSKTFSTFPPGLRKAKLRAIGLALLVMDPPPGTPAPVPPPSFESITWCVTVDVDDRRTAA